MKAFITANESFALRADGQFLGCFNGKTGLNSPPCYIEALPFTPKLPVNFHLNCIPKDCGLVTAYNLKNAMLFKLSFKSHIEEVFKTYYQHKHQEVGALVTVYTDGRTHIVCETARHVETITLPHSFKDFTSTTHNGLVIVHTTKPPYYLAVFNLDNGVAPTFSDLVEEFEITPVFRIKTRYFDLERTFITREYDFKKQTSKTISITRGNPYAVDKGEVFLKRAFFERLLIGAEANDMLSDELKPHSEKIKMYLGDFTDVLPDFCAEKGVCLAYDGIDIRPTKLFDLTIRNGFIDNISEV